MIGMTTRGRNTGDPQEQREDRARTQGEDGHLQAKDRGLKRNHSCPHLNLGLSASRHVGK